MSYPSKRVELKELNPHIMCVLCGGYLIQATTIIECLHSFCKSCILNFLETSDVCPICDVKVHKTWPLMNIRLDQTLQSLVYKIVPGLFQDEMRKRREYHWTVSDSYVKTLNLEERGDAVMEKEFTTGPDQISLVLQMVSREEESSSLQVVDQRYLLCPAEFTIGLLKKFVRMKFDLTSQNKIVMYKAKEELTDDLMLQDVAYIYLWKKDKPFHLFYSVGKSPFLRKRWSCPPTKKSISAALTSVSTAIGTFLAREDSPPASVINTTADTKTVPKLTSVIPSRETTVKSQKVDTKTNIKRIKSEELHGPPSSKSSQMAKTTSASVAPSPSASLPNTFPPTPSSVIATTSTTMMPSKCTVTSVSSPPSSSSSLSSPMPPHKKGHLCSSSSSSPLSSSSSSSLTSTSIPILSSNNTVLKTTISPSSTSLTSSAKQNGATTPVKSLHPGPKKSSMPTDQQVKSGNLVNSPPPQLQSSSKRKTEAVKSTKSLGQIPAVSYSKSSVIQDQAKIRIPKTVLVPVQESPKITSSNTFVPNSISKPVSNSHKTTMGTSTTITKSSYSNTHCSSNDFRTYNSHLSHTSPIPKVATTTASITTPKHNVHSKVYSVTSSNKALASSPDNNKSYKIKIQSSPSLSDVNVKDQVKQFAIPSPNTPVDQTGRVRKHKQQPGSSPQTVPSLSPGPKPSPVKDGHKSRGEISAGPTGNNSKLVTGAGSNSQLECNKSQNAGTDIGKQSSKVNIVNSKSECSNRVSYAKSSAPLPSLSSPSSSLKSSSSSSSSLSLSSPSSSTTSSIPTSPLLAKSFSNSGRIIHSVESILSPTPKQDSSKLVNKADVMDKTSALSKEKSLRLDCDMPKDLNEVTAQYVTTVWKEAFGNTITNKVDKKVDICDNKLLSKQKVQSNVSPKLPVQFSKAQKPLNGNGNSLKRPNKDTDTVSVAIKSNKILVDNKKCSSNEDSKMDYLQHVPSSSPSLNNHQSKVPNDRQMKSENKDSQKCSPVPSQHSPKCQRRPPVLLHKSMSCDESKSSSQQKNMNVVSPLEKRNWKKRKLSEIDQELSSSLSSPQMSTTLSHPQQQIGVKRRCLTPDVVTKAIVDEFGKCCETVEDRKNTVNSISGGKESSDSAFSSFPHSSPLLPFKQGLDYHRQLHLQNYQHYHHFHNNKNQANFPPMTTSALFLRTLPDSVVKSNQMAINASYVTNNNNNTNRVCKQVNNSCPNPIQSQPPKTATNPSSTSTSSTSRPSPADLSRFYSKSSTTTGTGTDKIETEPMSTASSHNHNHNHDRNNNMSVMGHDTDHLSKPGDKHRKMNQAISNKPLDRQSLTSTSASSSSSSYSKINSTYSSSGVFLDSHQRQYSPKTKAAVNHEYRVARGQHQPSLHPYHQPTLPSPGAKPSDSVKKLYDYSKKNEQDVTRNISIDVNSSSNTITPIASTSDNSAVSVSSESSMSSSPSQTSPSNSTCTVMTSPRSSLTSPGTDATSPGTEDRLDNAVLPVECRTPCDDGGASTPPYAMASILTTSVSSKPSTPLDLTNKPRKVQ